MQGVRVGFRRDKDIPNIVAGSSACTGFFGSDTLFEAADEIKNKVQIRPVLKLGARFAIAARKQEAEETGAKLVSGEPLIYATSNVKQLEAVAGERGFKIKDIVERGGGVEAAPDDDPMIDAIFDIVVSGRTIDANGLVVIADELRPIYLLNGWKKPAN